MAFIIKRREALKLGASAAAIMAAGQANAQAIPKADVAAPNLPIEKGATLRLIRPAKFVEPDEVIFRANSAKFAKEFGVEVKVDLVGWEDITQQTAVSANTGAGPDALMLCKDKALAKQLLSFHRIRVARFVVSRRERPLKRLRRFTYPAFVKPIGEESSDGIALASLAKTEDEVLERARFLHDRFETDALIEEYVDGREIYMGVLGNKRLTVFPPREIFFGQPLTVTDHDDPPRFATAKAKWDDAYRKKWGIRNGPAEPMSPPLERKLAEIARRVCRILHVRGLGRIDARLTAAATRKIHGHR